jgi:membrane carboxypeptidase/penicillin-binding protein
MCAHSSAGGITHERPYNRAVLARRQPGSSIKPIVYAKAIEDSVPANTIIPDTALTIELPGVDEPYKPTEIDGKFWGSVTMREGKPSGAMTLREGLIHSRNMVAIQLGLRAWNGLGRGAVAAARHQHSRWIQCRQARSARRWCIRSS